METFILNRSLVLAFLFLSQFLSLHFPLVKLLVQKYRRHGVYEILFGVLCIPFCIEWYLIAIFRSADSFFFVSLNSNVYILSIDTMMVIAIGGLCPRVVEETVQKINSVWKSILMLQKTPLWINNHPSLQLMTGNVLGVPDSQKGMKTLRCRWKALNRWVWKTLIIQVPLIYWQLWKLAIGHCWEDVHVKYNRDIWYEGKTMLLFPRE